ncbi:hypothetical protein MJ046_06740 [Acinetobacter bereziniae]|uniref:hypothetical protein n=1 Tax=Acinetobacter bereziniae TaxID=106648 RepID=UPI0022EA693C|nr:hypothetical protein [Acinetobacter bereziniae]MDA3440036.1 hypothetical protein [Acinetobacter bereziniae]
MIEQEDVTYVVLKKIKRILSDFEVNVRGRNLSNNQESTDLREDSLILLNSLWILIDKIGEENSINFLNLNLLKKYCENIENASRDFLDLPVNDRAKEYLIVVNRNLNKILSILKSFVIELEIREVDEKILYLDDKIENINKLNENIKNKETHDVYNLAAKENQEKSDNFRLAFLILIFVSIVFVWFCAVTKTYFGLSQYDYWFFKGTLVLTSVTLIAYFLKQSVKYQKIADQCRQTKLELEAFPSFVASFITEDPKIIEIRRELALKYFGRELDNSAKNETSSIISDQMKNTTELVKATTEAIKNLNTNQGGG